MKISTNGRLAVSFLLMGATTAPLLALVSAGDSAVGMVETVSPTTGSLLAPLETGDAPITVTFSGAADDDSAVGHVELWYRKEGESWAWSGESEDAAAGDFEFTPPGSAPGFYGVYYFDVVVEDSVGNRTTAPSGSTGEGQTTTEFFETSSVEEWWIVL